MIQLKETASGEILGEISKEDLQVLIDALVEETETDTDYYINRQTLELLKEKGASETLMGLLEKGMGEREDMDIEWIES